MKKDFNTLFSIVGIAVFNLLILDILVFKGNGKASFREQKVKLSEVDFDECGEDCKNFLKENVSMPTFPPIGGEASIPQTVYLPAPVTVTKTTDRKETIINILDSGENANTGWNDLPKSDFAMDIGAYKNPKVILLANLKIFQGNGGAVLRLFNVTDGMPVVDSEISTSSEDFVPVESGAINIIWKGIKTYRLQIKSLTGYDAKVNSAKLKIVSD